MKSIDIINVAGLLMDGKKDGLEMELREKVQPRFLRTIAPTPLSSAMEHPSYAVERAVLMIREAIRDIEAQFGTSNVVLVGRSNGGYMALLALVADTAIFQKVSKAVLIEGPLHPNVLVTPSLPPLMTCGIHYQVRPGLMNEAMDRLHELGTSRLVVVQGGVEDSIVPVAAQIIPGDFEILEPNDSSYDFSSIAVKDRTRGLIVKLPQSRARDDGMKRLLPEGYRNHLFWGDEKMAMILKIIESAGGEW